MVDPIPGNEQPSEQQTRLRTMAAPSPDNAPTHPSRGRSQAASTPRPKRPFHRLLIAAVAVAGIAAIAVVLVLLLRSTPIEREAPLPPAREEPAPLKQQTPAIPPPEVPVVESPVQEGEPGAISAYQQRLMALSAQDPPDLSAAERERRLEQLFNRFEQAIQAGNLSLPATDSASEYLIQLTALAPDDSRVMTARSMLVQSYLEQAHAARTASNWEEADRYLQNAIEIRLSRTYLQGAPNQP